MAQIQINGIIYGSTFASDITYKNTTVEKQLDLMPIFDVTDNTNVENDSNDDYLTYANILDSLNSNDTDKALSANQGRILNEKFDNIDFSELENGITINSEQIHNLNLDLEDFSKSFNNEYISNCDVFEEIEKEITKRGQMTTFCLSFGGDLINAPTDSWIWFSVLYKNARIIAFNKDSIAILHRNNGTYDGWKIINPDNITSLNNKVPFSFGVDANGNYGYIKDGADTVTPFLKSDFIDINRINGLNLETKTLSDGSKWLKVFYHDCSTGIWFNTVDTINFVNDTYRYNLMNCLEMFKRYESSKYEFLLEYPELGDNYTNRWSQTSNPTTTYNAVSGYTAISIKISTNFKGMALTDTGSTTSTWMDGQAGNTSWWFAIGVKKAYQNGGFPGPANTVVKKVKLWLRIA